ncbi:MAG: ABC transporter substrate-binding protein, partial [Cellulomonadaceae bacterium]
MKARWIRGAAVAATLALALAGCGSSDSPEGDESGAGTGGAATLDPEEQITLNLAWWGNEERAGLYKQAVDLFQSEHTNITVQTQFQAWGDYWPARNTEAAGNSLPDVFQMDLAYLRQYANNNQLRALDDQIGVNLDVSGFQEQLLASGNVGGEQVAIPTSTNTLALIYSPDALAELGVELPGEGYTWDDYFAFLAEAGAATQAKGIEVWGSEDMTSRFYAFLQTVIQSGKQPFTEDGELGFDEADLLTWLEKITTARDEGAFHPAARTVQIQPLIPMTANAAATMFEWDVLSSSYGAESGKDNLGLLPVPAGEDGKTHMYQKPAMLMTASANTEHPEAAATLIDFLVNDPRVGEIFGTSKGIPATEAQRDAMNLEEGSLNANIVAYEESVADQLTEQAPFLPAGFGALEAEYMRLGSEHAYGQITSQEFV